MAYVSANIASVSLFARITNAFENFRQASADHRLYMRTVRELNQLSNRELSDLGLSRGGLHGVAYESVYGK
jgi:uncharacterized protein YjiS (DUF1127 family)